MGKKSKQRGGERQPLLPKEEVDDSGCLKARHSLALLAFLGFFNVYCMRVNLSVALVAMVNSTSSDNSSESDECLDQSDTNSTLSNSTVVAATGEFDWNENTQALVLGAFFYGYTVTQVPGGWLAERFGGKRLFGYGCLVTALLTLLTPVAARAGVPYLVVVRVLEGMGEGVTCPALHAMWAMWAPLYERSKLVAFALSGSQLGTVFAMPISGVLCEHGFAGGWPSVFYVFGALGCAWFVLWMLMVYDSPSQHPRISDSERRFIEASVGKRTTGRKRAPVPWLHVFTSPAVWGIIVTHFANNWGFYSMLNSLPTYMKNILHFRLTQNGFLSAAPYAILWLTQMTSGQIADCIRRQGFFSTVGTRKLLNTIGLLCPACLLVATGYAGCDYTLAVVLLTIGVGGSGFTTGGYAVNHLDIAPDFAGTLMGITNAIATVPGFLGPAVVGVLTNHHQTVGQWRIFFFITAGVYLAGILTFLLLGQGEVQPWARPADPQSGLTSTLNQECIVAAPPHGPPFPANRRHDSSFADEDDASGHVSLADTSVKEPVLASGEVFTSIQASEEGGEDPGFRDHHHHHHHHRDSLRDFATAASASATNRFASPGGGDGGGCVGVVSLRGSKGENIV
ncbi:sialin-like [Babylonia areolata]|uniref:sialin-like n=1 Tax=Babylonia areolata TaxID=304850 RepID=UPI003FCEFE33